MLPDYSYSESCKLHNFAELFPEMECISKYKIPRKPNPRQVVRHCGLFYYVPRKKDLRKKGNVDAYFKHLRHLLSVDYCDMQERYKQLEKDLYEYDLVNLGKKRDELFQKCITEEQKNIVLKKLPKFPVKAGKQLYKNA